MRFARSDDGGSSRVGRLPGRSDGSGSSRLPPRFWKRALRASPRTPLWRRAGWRSALRTSCSGTRTPCYWRFWEQEGLQFAQSVGPFAEKGTWPEAAERLTSALITYHRSRPRLAAALLIEEQRLRAATPRGVLTITDDAVFAILEHVPGARHKDWTIAARYLSAMLCSMGVVAGRGTRARRCKRPGWNASRASWLHQLVRRPSALIALRG